MRRVRRVQVVEAEPTRVRRPPRTLLPDGKVAVTLVVSAEIVRGSVSEKDFAAWVSEAVHSYHRWRNGWVGIGATGGIDVPQVIVADDG